MGRKEDKSIKRRKENKTNMEKQKNIFETRKHLKLKRPKGQMMLKPEELEEFAISYYEEPYKRVRWKEKFFNINKEIYQDVPPTHPIIVNISPDVFVFDKEIQPDSDFELPEQNERVEEKSQTGLPPLTTAESDDGGEFDGRKREGAHLFYGDENENLDMGSSIISSPMMIDYASTSSEEVENEEENEDQGSEDLWPEEKISKMQMFRQVHDITQIEIEPMKTFVTQPRQPNIAFVGGSFDKISAYEAYNHKERNFKEFKENYLRHLEELEKELEEKEGKYNNEPVEDDNILEDLKNLGHHKTKTFDEEIREEDVVTDDELEDDIDNECLICECSSPEETVEDSSEDELSSSSEEETEESIDEYGEEETDDENELFRGRLGEDINGYLLLPYDYIVKEEGSENDENENSVESMIEPTVTKTKDKNLLEDLNIKEKEVERNVKLTISQKQQILNYLISGGRRVNLKKGKHRDVDFEGPDSDDDDLDDGEYLMAVYGYTIKEPSESDIIVPIMDDKPTRVEGEGEDDEEEFGDINKTGDGKNVEEKKLTYIDRKQVKKLKKLHRKHEDKLEVLRAGGIEIENEYKKIRGISKVNRKKVLRVLANKKEVLHGKKTKQKQIRLLRKLEIKRALRDKEAAAGKLETKTPYRKIPKQRGVVIFGEYQYESKFHRMYFEELNALTLLTRFLHKKRYPEVGKDYIDYMNYFGAVRHLFPLTKISSTGKKMRVTHISSVHHAKMYVAISYESIHCAEHSKWREGYIAIYHPIANSQIYDFAFKFKSGVRFFDICTERAKHGQTLVGLEDGNIQLIKIPFPNVVKSTTISNKHACPVVQVHWLSDWYGRDITDVRGNVMTPEGVPRFVSFATDGIVKFWLIRRLIGFVVYITIHFQDAIIPQLLESPRCVKVTCMSIEYHDRSLIYMGASDGKFYKYDTMLHPQTFLFVHKAHDGRVNDVAVNYFNKDVCLSGGQDGLVHLWRGNGSRPLWTYFLGFPVVCIRWSRTVSYIWAVITRDRYVRVYNLERNFHKPLACHQVMARAYCETLEFHDTLHLIYMADSLANVYVFKITRMILEPEVVEHEYSWDIDDPVDDGKDPFTRTRDRLKVALDRNDILVSALLPIDVKGTLEKKVESSRKMFGLNPKAESWMCWKQEGREKRPCGIGKV